MDGFLYSHGDRPLDGYTVQRGIGRGGFGEVYYAVSDAGREVALKAVSGYEQIEVRGVSQCMNLKSPHLVSIFDIKLNPQGKAFVIMEYVGGPCLKELIEQSPAGLGAAKTAFFLREIGKGLSFLHERGIVHRDLKPGNIFYEDGYVKIGDYGLSKAIGVSRHSGQTITVGTVHYMAPEVGMGKYDRSIDIYALGIVLYEMLTGQVPFFGSSHGEILMKHLMSQPDLTGIEEPFATVIRKAMSKDPAERYQSVQEMVEAVFGEEHVRNSVSCFSPDSLTMVAGRVAQKVAVGTGGSSGPAEGGYGTYKPPATDAGSDVWANVAQRVEHLGEQLGDRVDRWGERFGDAVSRKWGGRQPQAEHGSPSSGTPAAAEELAGDPANDPLDRRQRRWLSFVAAVTVGMGAGLASGLRDGFGFFAIPIIVLGAAGITVAARRLTHRLSSDSDLLHRLALGGTAALFICAVLPFYFGSASPRMVDHALGTLAAMGAALLLVDWRQRIATGRAERVDLGEAFVAGLAAWAVCLLTEGYHLMAGGTLAGISLAVQVAAPWDPLAAKRRAEQAKPSRRWWKGISKGASNAGGSAAQPLVGTLEQPRFGDPAVAAAGRMSPAMPGRPLQLRQLPGWIRTIFIGLFIVLVGTGILLLVAAGMGNFRGDDFAIMVSFGVGMLLCSLFFLTRALKQTYRSYWSGLIRPFLMLLCLQSALTSIIVMGAASRLHDDELIIGLAFIIFPTLLLIVLAFISDRSVSSVVGQFGAEGTYPWPSQSGVSTQDAFVALLLACGGFLGLAGLHRFYAGRYLTGLLWVCTVGFLGFGTIFDVVIISMGLFRDRRGLPLRVWMGVERVPPTTAGPSALPDWPVAGQPRTGAEVEAQGAHVQVSAPRGDAGGVEPVRRNTRPLLAPAMTNRWLAAPGNVLLFVAMVLGLLIAIDLPELVAAGFPDPSFNRDLTSAFGYSDWPKLVRRMARFMAILAGLAGTTTLLIARRRSGAAHTGRALLAAIGLVMSIAWLADACDSIPWIEVMTLFEEGQAGFGLESLFARINSAQAIAAGIAFLGSIVVLAWPEHRERLDAAAQEHMK